MNSKIQEVGLQVIKNSGRARPVLTFVGAALAAAVVLAGCADSSGDEGSGDSKTLHVGVIFPDTQGFYAGVLKGIEDGAADAGQKVEINQTNTQDDASKEATFMQTLISSKVDAILSSAISGEASVPAIKQAVDADIPVVCYNTCINPDDAEKYVSAYAYGDPVEFGYKLGQAAAEYFQSKGITDPKIGVLNCEFVEVCVQRREGFEKALKETVPDYEIVDNQEATDPVKSISVGQNMLRANSDIDALMGESGGATIGAVKAVEQADMVGKTVVFGGDMTTDIANALKDHSILVAEVDVSGQAVGLAAIKAAIDTINGDAPSEITVPVPVDLYTTPEDASGWLSAHPDGIP